MHLIAQNMSKKIKLIKILILEDDTKTLSVLLKKLHQMENDLLVDFAVTVFSEYIHVKNYLNKMADPEFDIILLDRDCILGSSFHCLDVNKFDTDKIISISSMPQYNENARKFGVDKIAHKDYKKLDEFADKVILFISKMID